MPHGENPTDLLVQTSQPKRTPRLIGTMGLLAALLLGMTAAFYAIQNWGALARTRRLKNPVPATPAALTAGLQVYRQHCQRCHGEQGDGKGEKAAELSVAPGDFTDAAKMRKLTDGELFFQVTKGRLPMPAFADKLSDMERWQVVDFIRTFTGTRPGATSSSIPCNPPQQK